MATSFTSLATPLAPPSLTPNSTADAGSSFPFLGSLLLKMASTFGYLGGSTATSTIANAIVETAREAIYEPSIAYEPTGGREESIVGGSFGTSGTTDSSTEIGGGAAFSPRKNNRGMKGVGYIFSYLTSSWALLCVVMAILLNRTHIYASLRRPIRLSFRLRFLIRIVPIILFLGHIRNILFALRCQTSPYLPTDLYTEAADIPYAANDQGGFLYYLSRGLTFWHPSADSDVAICQLASMLPSHPIEQTLSENRPVSEDGSVKGSLELLWPLYKTISLSLFLSTFSHALTGRSSGGASPLPSTSSDTGLTLFEDSLVFAEAEAVVDPRTGNVSPEVLYIALVSSFAHLTAQIVGLVAGTGAGGTNGSRGSLAKYRLVTTGIWGVAFLGGFAWALWKGGGRVLGFPTVCVLGFIPHLLVFFGILVCGAIYILAAIFSTLSSPVSSHSVSRGADVNDSSNNNSRGPALNFQNLQANITLSTLSISLSEDFYTALLKVGFMCLTAASEATYLNEGEPIRLPGLTWLEKERIRVLERERKWKHARINEKSGNYSSLVKRQLALAGKGVTAYNNEVKDLHPRMVGLDERGLGDNGVEKKKRKLGARRGGRWVGAVEFLRGVGGVTGRWGLTGALGLLRILRLVKRQEDSLPDQTNDAERPGEDISHFDIELHNRGERIMHLDDEASNNIRTAETTEPAKRRLWYDFLTGPLDEEEDESGDYNPEDSDEDEPDHGSNQDIDDETVSQNSEGQSEWDSQSEYGYDSSGRSTPTQKKSSRTIEPYLRGRSITPEAMESPIELLSLINQWPSSDLPANLSLAALLDPQTAEQRHWAKILARHLSSNEIITRRKNAQLENAMALSSSIRGKKRAGVVGAPGYGYLGNGQTHDADTLENVLLERRGLSGGSHNRQTYTYYQTTTLPPPSSSSNAYVSPTPADPSSIYEEQEAPMCVICQSSPRTIIVWPCRCLALCEECRVSLAMRNFGSCVCCRRELSGFSRIWVP